jgi:hypothetical protein
MSSRSVKLGGKKHWLYSPYWAVGICVAAVLVGVSAFERHQIAVEMGERRARVEAEAAALRAQEELLQERVEYLSHERGIEAELRRQFDVARDGEQVVVIVDEVSDGTVYEPLATTVSSSTESAWYEFWR